MNDHNGVFQTVAPKRAFVADLRQRIAASAPDLVNTQTMDRNLMTQIITRYLVAILLVSLGFFGVGALASAQELRDPMQPSPPLAVQKFREG